jgi:hypothetical protein
MSRRPKRINDNPWNSTPRSRRKNGVDGDEYVMKSIGRLLTTKKRRNKKRVLFGTAQGCTTAIALMLLLGSISGISWALMR